MGFSVQFFSRRGSGSRSGPERAPRLARGLVAWGALLSLACGPPPPPTQGAGGQTAKYAPASAAKTPPRTPANVMGFEGAAWLEREGRDQEEKPEVVLAAMELREGMTVAEIGAGTGYFSRRIGKVLGPSGKVLAVDIQPKMLELLKEYAAKEGVGNLVPIVSTESDPKLPEHGVDRILLVDVYHEFQKPQEMLAKIKGALAPGGRVILVEYRAEDDSAKHILVAHRMSVDQVLAEWLPAGFELVRREESLPSQHLFVFTSRRGVRAPGEGEKPLPPGRF